MKTILLSLNEVNFEFVKQYIGQNKLPNFNSFFSSNPIVETTSEKEFHNQEPWIQWVTLHTGKTLKEHKIFRLGDIQNLKYPQVFEEIENRGNKVGLIFPFNTDNRLKNPEYFLPDPWTETKISADPKLKSFFNIIRKLVNSNANGKPNKLDYLKFLLGFMYFVPIQNWSKYLKYLTQLSLPGTKAIILDQILGDVFLKFEKTRPTDFSNLMLNACAHVQHHYLFNSEAYQGKNINPEWYCPKGHDRILNALKLYDNIHGLILKRKSVRVIVATAWYQQPHEDNTYFWRFNDHANFAS